MVKRLMKTASGFEVLQLDIRQQALKLTANRFVFFLASSLSVPNCYSILPSVCKKCYGV